MTTGNRQLPKARSSRLSLLLSGVLVLVGVVSVATGLILHRHISLSAHSSLNALQEKVAAIPVSEEESASLYPLASPGATTGPVLLVAEGLSKSSAQLTPTVSDSSTAVVKAVVAEGIISRTATTTVGDGAEGAASSTTATVTAPVAEARAGEAASGASQTTQDAVAAGTSVSTRGAYDTTAPYFDAVSLRQVDPTMRVQSGQVVFSFKPADLSNLPSLGSLPPATRIRIPAIDVVSPVLPLDLRQDKRGQWSYEKPDRGVGRIATAGNPGEGSRGWYFGHVLSPFHIEDGAFQQLPQVVDLVLAGKTVDVIVESENAAYLYQVTGKPVILSAYEMDNGYFHSNLYAPRAEIVLTTCVPAWSSDHRLLVKARLVGVGPLP